MNFRSKLMLGVSTALSFSLASFSAHAAEVSSWAELKAAKTQENITFNNDIQATGEEFPMPISFNLSTEQTIDGNYFSFSEVPSQSGYYSLSINNTANLNLKNLGKYSDGDAGDNTFSYQDLSGNTVYKKIEKSVNSFSGYFLTVNSAITVDINNSVFADNGKNTDARLIYVNSSSSGTLQITDSIFYNNTMASAGPVVNGGKSNINVENSIFYGNKNVRATNTTKGGALLSEGGTVVLRNSYFINNYVNNAAFTDKYGKGGAVYIDKASGHIIENVKFEGNTAAEEGGAVYTYYKASTDYIKNSEFINNTSMGVSDDVYGGGGGIATGGGYVRTIDNVLFDGNFSGNKGGGLYVEELSNTPSSPKVILVKDTTFNNNEARLGGGMYFSADYGNNAKFSARLVDPEFTSNTATKGGGLYVENGDVAIISENKDVIFSGNTASDTSLSNAGDDIYFRTKSYAASLFLNAAENKKIVFGGSVAAAQTKTNVPVININKSGVTYSTYEGETETVVDAGTVGEIQFNNKVGDENGNIYNINLYGGKLSVGPDSTVDNPDGLINYNNFTVEGASVLNTANDVIGEFAPATFNINADLQYEFDIDLANAVSDKLTGAINNGSLTLATLNVITDADADELKITYSDTNINGTLKEDYTITTSTATYGVTAENDDTGSYLLFSKESEVGGLPSAIQNGSDAYSVTGDSDEVITAWSTNDLKADLTINGNGHAFTTENQLDGINVGSTYTLTMNDVADMRGFNYALSNEGTVVLKNSVISDAVINNGTLEINENVSLGNVSGAGIMNINADHELKAKVSGNTVNVNNAQLSGVNNLAADTTLNVYGGTADIGSQTVTVKKATFDSGSALALTVNRKDDHGQLIAENITVTEGAVLKATLAQGIVGAGETVTLRLLKADNTDFNNFADSFDNNMYHFEKADKNGNYKITLTNSGGDVVDAQEQWVVDAAKGYIDVGGFAEGSVAQEIADKLTALAQNDAAALVKEIKSLAPTETAVVQNQSIKDANRLFKAVDAYLRGERDAMGISSGDAFEDAAVWAKPYMGKAKVSNRGDIAGQEAESIGVILGVEKKTSDFVKLGAGFQYDKTDVDAFRRDMDVSTMVGFVYGEYKPSNWFVNAVGSYAYSDYDESKAVLGSAYTAHYNAGTFSMATMTGYQFKYVTPEAGLHYYYIKRDGYKDTAEQQVHKSYADYLRATAGVRLARNFGMFTPNAYFGIGYDIVSDKNNTFVQLSNGAGYTVTGKRLSRWEYEAEVGLSARPWDGVTLGISYMGAYREKYYEHTGMLKFKYDF